MCRVAGFGEEERVVLGEVEESGRAELDTPPFAKCAKGRAPRLCVRRGEPIQRSFSFGFVRGLVEMAGHGQG